MLTHIVAAHTPSLESEVRLENGRCVCDRNLGYYGNDVNNCMLAEMMCSSPGFELKDNGKCQACADDFYKPEASAGHICRRKSSCHESQDIANNGSTTTDRSCKAKITKNLLAIKYTTEDNNENNDDNDMSSGNLLSIIKRLENLEKEVKRLTKSNRRINRKLKTKTRLSDKKRKVGKRKRKSTKRQKKNTKTVTINDNTELQKSRIYRNQ
ncbi:TN [Mytilus edulis]|uniref:TN n=1 Tax=Mytilus edulis TaxID=6550 RepID=A0A8S3RIM2_MYTED|nr:TN [Mytilus edulis]